MPRRVVPLDHRPDVGLLRWRAGRGSLAGVHRSASDPANQSDEAALMALFRAIASRDLVVVSRVINSSPELAVTAIRIAASRDVATEYFLDSIMHYVYAGDTALHIAAAAYQLPTAELLVAEHAHARARNRRGAEPLHYAADGIPGDDYWDPSAQHSIIEYLISAGGDPNACDNSGVAALHRAVRTRCLAAARALLENGADVHLMNKRGSTPFHLAVQNTGRSSAATDVAKQEQRKIIELLVEYGAKPTDKDAKGKTVMAAASSDWIRELLA